MVDVREFIKLVCSCVICHTCASVDTVWDTEEMLLHGVSGTSRALTRDGTLDKVNGNLVPCTHCLVLEALLATPRTGEKCLFLSCSEPFCLIMQKAMLQ